MVVLPTTCRPHEYIPCVSCRVYTYHVVCAPIMSCRTYVTHDIIHVYTRHGHGTHYMVVLPTTSSMCTHDMVWTPTTWSRSTRHILLTPTICLCHPRHVCTTRHAQNMSCVHIIMSCRTCTHGMVTVHTTWSRSTRHDHAVWNITHVPHGMVNLYPRRSTRHDQVSHGMVVFHTTCPHDMGDVVWKYDYAVCTPCRVERPTMSCGVLGLPM